MERNPESLTKENFWNGMMEKYPQAMANFCQWVDEYKQRAGWENLFDHYYGFDSEGKSRIKYHDLPLAMQIGIWAQFMCEHHNQMDEARKNWIIGINEDLKQLNDGKLL